MAINLIKQLCRGKHDFGKKFVNLIFVRKIIIAGKTGRDKYYVIMVVKTF